MPIENNSNYNYPITVAGPSSFTATATGDTAEIAEATARTQAFIKATSAYGVGTTQIVGQEEVRVRLNNDAEIYGSEVPTTYTATYTLQAEQISPAKTPDPVPVVAPSVVAPPADTPPADTPPIVSPPTVDPDPNAPVGNSDIQHYKPTPVNVNPNGDPNPNAVITPPSPNQPSNLQVASVGLQGPKNDTIAQQTGQDAVNKKTTDDWRVRLSLAQGTNYLYNAKPAGLLAYLAHTDGVVFPYVPQIQITYAANYETADIVHTNYKMIQYKNSAVDQITITGDFTAQDTYEANYMLAVIHFFRSVTKMFYGKDQIPKPGTPPPLCYLHGLGNFQFDNHPLVISSFNYNLPNDVDYIRASSPTLLSGLDSTAYNPKGQNQSIGEVRLGQLNTGATESPPDFGPRQATNREATYVPTKMSISITAFPIVTRNNISNTFSLKKYATGELLQGSINPRGGGIW
jgi:hypothetical protein